MIERFKSVTMDGSIRIGLGEKGFWEANKREVLEAIISICEQYDDDGYTLTLRQLYYQLVSKDLIPNHDKVYKKLSSLKDTVVYAGLVDWSIFEDRGRVPSTPYCESSVSDALSYTARTYRLNRQKKQPIHVEVWTEKDAISSILKRVTEPMGMTLVVNKGYSSSTAMYEAYDRFFDILLEGKKVKILYFGDHDPSGLDMIRDIRERILFFMINGEQINGMGKVMDDWWYDEDRCISDELDEMKDEPLCNNEEGVFNWDRAFFLAHFEVQQIGLTMDQIEEYEPPHNPAKITDPRAKKYVAEFGEKSWEVDALSPKVMEGIVKHHIEDTIDMEVLQSVLDEENTDKSEILEIVKGL